MSERKLPLSLPLPAMVPMAALTPLLLMMLKLTLPLHNRLQRNCTPLCCLLRQSMQQHQGKAGLLLLMTLRVIVCQLPPNSSSSNSRMKLLVHFRQPHRRHPSQLPRPQICTCTMDLTAYPRIPRAAAASIRLRRNQLRHLRLGRRAHRDRRNLRSLIRMDKRSLTIRSQVSFSSVKFTCSDLSDILPLE